MEKWMHKWQVKKQLGKTEPELMEIVSQGRIKGFDQHYQPVKHYGRYHADQTEDDRLPGAVLSTRIAYFDCGDIVDFALKEGITLHEITATPNPNIPEPQHDTAPIPAATAPLVVISADDHIKQRKAEGAKIEVIASELWDRQGRFKMNDLDICRILGLDKGSFVTIGALKNRSRRLRLKSKKLKKT